MNRGHFCDLLAKLKPLHNRDDAFLLSADGRCVLFLYIVQCNLSYEKQSQRGVIRNETV